MGSPGCFRAAVVQAAPVVFDTPRTLAKLADLAADAARQGAAVAVFPEAFVSAYPKGLDFGARVGSRSAEGREQFRRYFDSAIEVPGPATEAMGNVARESVLHLVVGVIDGTAGHFTAPRCSLVPMAASWAGIAS